MNVIALTIIRTAFALNNIGIALLDIGCYDEAIVILQDALRIVQQSIPHRKQTQEKNLGKGTVQSDPNIHTRMMVDAINHVYDLAVKRFLLIISSHKFARQPSTSRLSRYVVELVTWSNSTGSCYSTSENLSDSFCNQVQLLKGEAGMNNRSGKLTSVCERMRQLYLFPIRIEDIYLNHFTTRVMHDQSSNSSSSSILSEVKEYNFEFSLVMNNIAIAELLAAEVLDSTIPVSPNRHLVISCSKQKPQSSLNRNIGRNNSSVLRRHAMTMLQTAASLGLNDTEAISKIISIQSYMELPTNTIHILDCLINNWVVAITCCCSSIPAISSSSSSSSSEPTRIPITNSLLISIQQCEDYVKLIGQLRGA